MLKSWLRIVRRGGCLLAAAALITAVGCGDADTGGGGGSNSSSGSDSGKAHRVLVDGSSTVFPITAAMAEAYAEVDSELTVDVSSPSGTGGGFKKFMVGETDINDASRPIKDSEVATCRENGIEFVELTVAVDGISVVVNRDNDWCDTLSVAQLKKLWEPDSTVSKWSDLSPGWPDEAIKLYGPDADSGTFDYFTEEIIGESKAIRKDYEPSTNDNILVSGVSGDKYALGYFGYAYYVENKDVLKAVAIAQEDGGEGVLPTDANIEGGKYVPLSRPLFIYVNRKRLSEPKVADFLKFYLGDGQDYVSRVGYVRLSDSLLSESKKALDAAIGG